MRGELNTKNIQSAIDFFNAALRKDQKFALAYTGLADASLRMYDENKDSFWTDKALNAAKQAQSLMTSCLKSIFRLAASTRQRGKPLRRLAN